MTEVKLGRRQFVVGVGAIGAGSVPALAPPSPAQAQKAPDAATPPLTDLPVGYIFFKPAEAAFVEALVDHMVPQDELTASGTELGIAIFIDRALAGSWGKGDGLYAQGPWKTGTRNQGYQLPLTPAGLYRAGIEGADAHCHRTFGRNFHRLSAEEKETFLKDLSGGRITLDGGLSGRDFFDVVYQTVMEGMFADPVYGGNRDKAAWRMLGFPGVMANNAEHVKNYSSGERFVVSPVGIADMS
jgi:gluconate 2-dehydrogenase gamma chain